MLSAVPGEAAAALGDLLRGRLGGDASCELVYRGSRDGLTGAAFHSRCDGMAGTVTLIAAEGGWVFGGYSSVPWHSRGEWATCEDAFLFTVTNPHGIAPTLYPVRRPGMAVYGGAWFGPSFGCGDVWVTNTSNSPADPFDGSSHSCLPDSFTDTTGRGKVTFTGASHFTPTEVETWRVTV